ncbi:MAG: DUF3556 domain-containing protein, partial [Thermoanaerobaculia bacterium]|nr:DUF3556 domain-containing protein [Thermoanaerobaculia bacterium]
MVPAAFTSLWNLAAVLFVCLFAIPCYGNFFPARVSFLLSMRYYAGNWAYNIWLLRKGSEAKLKRLTKVTGTMREQLQSLLPKQELVDAAVV